MKHRSQRLLGAVFYTGCAAALLAAHTSAYIDPATTSYIIQIVAGVVIACGTAAGIIFNKLRRKMKKKTPGEEQQPASKAQETDSGRGGVVTADDLLSDDEDSGK